MGRTSMDDENRLLSNEEEEEEEDEALSLSDLPIHEELGPESKELEEPQAAPPTIQLPEDDFDFGSATTEPEMCAADDVFFRGRILPLRHSVSSDSGLALLRGDSQRSLCRSGSMDNSSYHHQSHKSPIIRSSSTRSQYSSSCSSSRSSSTRTNNSTIPKLPKPPNPFQHYYYYTHHRRRPVPASLNRASKYVQGQMVKSNNNMWSIFRLGLVRTPTMEPLDIKFHRNPNQDVQSLLIGSTQGKEKDKKKHNNKFPYFGGGGCKCSAEAAAAAVVEPSRIASEKGPKEKSARRDMSRRHRTYEWLKELAVADDDDDDVKEKEEEGRGRDRGNLGKVEM